MIRVLGRSKEDISLGSVVSWYSWRYKGMMLGEVTMIKTFQRWVKGEREDEVKVRVRPLPTHSATTIQKVNRYPRYPIWVQPHSLTLY